MPIHCDTIINDESYPECIRNYLKYNRLPAVCKQAGEVRNEQWVEKDLIQYIWVDPEPVCFADYREKRVRLVMASRFGDVGITEQLDTCHGYDRRVFVFNLSNFSDKP